MLKSSRHIKRITTPALLSSSTLFPSPSTFLRHLSGNAVHQEKKQEPLKLQLIESINAKLFSARNRALPFSRTAVIYIHHALYTSLPVLQAKFLLGLDPKNTFVLNKSYSECADVVKTTKSLGVHYQPCSKQIGPGRFLQAFIRDINLLWEKAIVNLKDVDNVLIMDHGGYAMSYVPSEIIEKYNVVGLEKTTAGLINENTRGLPFPIIDVATCAAKKVLESPLISEAVVQKLTPLIPLNDEQLVCGVVGCGAIGRSIARKLLSLGRKVIIYDKVYNKLNDLSGAIFTTDLSSVISSADYIFGCTGNDITKNNLDIFRTCPRNKKLISCSSEDREFLSLIKKTQEEQSHRKKPQPFDDISYKNDFGAVITIIKGGFPINFDNTGESVPAEDIQLTRALVFTGALQATTYFNNSQLLNKSGIYMLNPNFQELVVDEWVKCRQSLTLSKTVKDQFHNRQWIAENSGGIYADTDHTLGQDKLNSQPAIGLSM